MFYKGDLQSGIAKAVQESKVVACFVTDDGEESKLWEDEYLWDESLKSPLSNQAIVLRLVAGSTEAGYLAAIYPLPKTPTLVIIQNADLKEYITSGVTKDEFIQRLNVVFQSTTPPQPTAASSSNTPSASTSTPSQPPSTPSQTSTSQPANPQQDPRVTSMLADRARRLEADKASKEAAARAQRQAEASARRAAAEADPAPGTRSADATYASQQRKRQAEARAERQRILQRVEDDKVERREKEARRKALAKSLAKEGGGEVEAPSSSVKPTGSTSALCAVQIRLFDGSTIRSRFPSSGSLRGDVRPWIDEHQAGDAPYTFKQVLTPQPNMNISISDEESTLSSLGLTPSATLILVPVQGYSTAYDGAGGGIASRIANGGYGLASGGIGLVSSGLGLMGGMLGSFMGGGASPSTSAPASGSGSAPAVQQTVPVVERNPAADLSALRERERDDQQFYNGNALNFEPRKDDDKKDD